MKTDYPNKTIIDLMYFFNCLLMLIIVLVYYSGNYSFTGLCYQFASSLVIILLEIFIIWLNIKLKFWL